MLYFEIGDLGIFSNPNNPFSSPPPGLLPDEHLHGARVLPVQELPGGLVPELLRLLPAQVLHPRERQDVRVLQKKLGKEGQGKGGGRRRHSRNWRYVKTCHTTDKYIMRFYHV